MCVYWITFNLGVKLKWQPEILETSTQRRKTYLLPEIMDSYGSTDSTRRHILAPWSSIKKINPGRGVTHEAMWAHDALWKIIGFRSWLNNDTCKSREKKERNHGAQRRCQDHHSWEWIPTSHIIISRPMQYNHKKIKGWKLLQTPNNLATVRQQ